MGKGNTGKGSGIGNVGQGEKRGQSKRGREGKGYEEEMGEWDSEGYGSGRGGVRR